MPRGDAEREQTILRGEQRPAQLFRTGRRYQAGDELARRVEQHAGRIPPLIAHDPARGRVWGVAGYPRPFQRLRVYPHPVGVVARQNRGTVWHQLVKQLPGRQPARENVAEPARTHEPRARVPLGVGANQARVAVDRVLGLEIAAEQREPAGLRVDVGVVESRKHRGTRSVDPTGPRSGEREDIGVAADGGDTAVGDGQRCRVAPFGEPQLGARDHEVGSGHLGLPTRSGRVTFPARRSAERFQSP